MMWTLTDLVVKRMIRKAIRNFCNDNNQPEEFKKALKGVEKDIVIHYNTRLRATWAWAILVNPRNKYDNNNVKYFKLDEKKNKKKIHPCLKDKKNYFFVLSLSVRIMQYVPVNDVFNIVSHEVAHILQLVLLRDTFHDKQWREFHRSMGGNGETFVPYNVPKKVLDSKTPIKKR